ncbi:MAG TPA: FG-GAP-like repeat-containing protein, partial [Blastocatellia bacterium]
MTAREMNDRRGLLGKPISVHAAGRGAPWINLRDGRDLPADYQGASKTSQALKANQARPLALASADFDEDGVPDLVGAYEATGGGAIAIQRGHEDTIFPSSLEAVTHRAQSTPGGPLASAVDDSASPFLLSSRAFDVSVAPHLLGAGDFDGDGHADVIAAALGGDKLLLLTGDGRGGLAPAPPVSLPGRVTTLVTGDVNRLDGLAEIIVGIDGTAGPKLLIFESGAGAIKSAPEAISLPAEAKSIALGQLDDDYPIDIAVAAGHNLIIVNGRDRKRPSAGANAIDDRPVITRLSFAFSILSAAIGDFTGSASQDVALLSEDGSARLMTRTAARNGESAWLESSATLLPLASKKNANDAPARLLTPLRVSASANDDLLVIDATGHQLHILIAESATTQSESASPAQAPARFRLSASLDVEGEPVDALPMRLNADALSDLVVIRNDQAAPAVLLTAPSAIFTVTNTNDSGAGSLRDAISSANSNPGSDTINFNIPGAGIKTIKPLSALPLIGGTLTIDGTTQSPGSSTPPIELDGSMALAGTKGLSVGAASCVIRGLIINSFDGNGIEISSSSNVHIEGNFIGTNAGGTASKANSESGVAIIVGDSNIIGGTTASAHNVVSGNSSHGVIILGPATGNMVQGNYIGTDKMGAVAIGNGSNGVSLISGNASVTNSIIGSPSAGNVVSGNTGFGVQFFGIGTGNLIQGNLVGTDATGFFDVGNDGGGVAISDAAGNTVGGTVAGVGNIISGNGINGVRINASTATNNRVQGNFIGTALNGSSPLPNDSDGVYVLNSASNTVIGAASGGGGNIIAFNGRNGVLIETGTANSVLSNSIFSNAGLGVDLGPAGVTPNDTGDADSGPNGLQNFPTLTSAASLGGGGISIQGTLNSAVGATFTLQFFASDSCDVSGNGEGQVFLGSAMATTNGSGNAAFNVTLSTSASSGQYVTATATDAQGSSSEFSACVPFGSSDLAISQTSSPASVMAGNKITYRITVTNNGPDAAVPATLSDNLPPSTAFVACSSAGGGVCGGSGNNRIVSFNSIAPGASAVVTIDAVVNCSVADGFVINNTATVSSIIHDPVAGNNSATVMNTVVNPPPALSPANASF